MKLQYQTYWTAPGDDEVNLRWISRFYARVHAASGGVPACNRVTDGCFITSSTTPSRHPGCSLAVSAGRFSLSDYGWRERRGQAAALRSPAGPNAAAKPCRQLG